MTAATPVTPATRARGGFCLAVTGTVVLMAAASAPSPFYPQLTEQLQLPPVATTLIFAIYAIPLLLALLTLGSLSDRVGRRGILTVGSVALSVSLLMFWAADSFLLLLAARALQGLAAGLLVPVLNAMMVDHEPSRWLGAAALANTVAPMAGLGLGALTAAGLLDLPGIDAGTIFLLLAAVFPLLAATAWTIPTPPVLPGDAGPDPRARRVSAATRRIIVSVAPAIIAGWVTNGLFLALGPGIIATRFRDIPPIIASFSRKLPASIRPTSMMIRCPASARTAPVWSHASKRYGQVTRWWSGSSTGWVGTCVTSSTPCTI